MSLAEEFRTCVDDQAADWSTMLFALTVPDELALDAVRLYMAPAQLERVPGERTRFTFRAARVSGYGAPAPLIEHCLTRVDEAGIDGELELVSIRHEARSNMTQGPV